MRPNILIVEDEYAMSATLREYLEHAYNVESANSGETALGFIERNNYKVILVDLNLPDLGGINVIKHISERWSKTAILVITGDRTLNSVEAAVEAGADDYLVKPIDKAQLHQRIEKAVAKRWMPPKP